MEYPTFANVFRTVLTKEITGYLRSSRFACITVLSVAMIALCTFLNVKSYEEKLNNYNLALREHRAELESAEVYSTLRPKVEFPLPVLSILNKGVTGQFQTTVTIDRERVPEIQTGSDVDNEYLALFSTLDISDVVTIVFSLLGLLLAFDSISGEKRNGTLKLMLTGKTPRTAVLLGKYAGGIIVLAVAQLIGLFAGLLVMLSSDVLVLGPPEWGRIAGFVAVSVIYASVFFLLGMVISTKTHHPATSLAFSLFFWALLVIVWPRTALFLGRRFVAISSPAVWEERINTEIMQGYGALGEFIKQNGNYTGVGKVSRVQFNGRTGVKVTGADETVENYFIRCTEYTEPTYWKAADRIWNIIEERQSQLNQQAKLVYSITCISPAFSYEEAGSILSESDGETMNRFWRYAREYRRMILTWITDNNLLQSPKWFKTEGPLAMDGFPEFTCRRETVPESMTRALLPGGILIFANILLFTASYVAFLSYDVR